MLERLLVVAFELLPRTEREVFLAEMNLDELNAFAAALDSAQLRMTETFEEGYILVPAINNQTEVSLVEESNETQA